MAFRFRRSIRLAKGVRINLSKSGASLSVGRRGATLNIGPHGEKMTVGLPGTGLSYTQTLGHRPEPAHQAEIAAPDPTPSPQKPSSGPPIFAVAFVLLAVAIIGGAILGSALGW